MVPKSHWLDHSESKYGHEFVQDCKKVMDIILLFTPQIIFWALVQQQSSRWIFQAKKMDRHLGWYIIEPDQLIVLIPIFIIILVPTFEKFLFPHITKIGINTPLRKITCGMSCAIIAFLISAYLETIINETRVSIFMLIPQYIFIAAAEVLVFVASITFAYTQSPPTMKSVMNSFVYLTTAGGNLIVLIVSGTQIFESQVNEFLFFAFFLIFVTVIFISIAMRYKYVK